MPDPIHTKKASRINSWIVAGIACLGAAGVFVMWNKDGNRTHSPNQTNVDHPAPAGSQISGNPIDGLSTENPTVSASGTSSSGNTATANTPHSEGPTVTRATRLDTVITPSGERKQLVDPMATSQNLPPWPEGPRLFAEVETSARKYVNLRPDNVGELPRVLASAEERIELRINFPEGNPGEKIFVELPNGGSFPDLKTFGRVYELPANRTLSFPYITDDANGYCTVSLRHRGHTRSLPIWVGEPPETGS